MRNPRDWDEEYILNLGTNELEDIDFKERRFLDLTVNSDVGRILDKLAKIVCAFANTNGGVIVVGIDDPDSVGGVIQVSDGGVSLTGPKGNMRDWLNDVIPDLVENELQHFFVYVVEGKSTTSQIAASRGIFLIHIPASDQAPHQSKRDKLYYMRFGSSSESVRHRMVADMFNRRQHPLFELRIKALVRYGFYRSSNIPGAGEVFTDDPSGDMYFELTFIARNVGRVYAQYINCNVYVPVEILSERYFLDRYTMERDSKRVVTRNNKEYFPMRFTNLSGTKDGRYYDPVLPQLATIWEQEFKVAAAIDPFALSDEVKILWEIFADNSKSTGEIALNQVEKTTKKRHAM